MAVTVADFRARFPEFAYETEYPNARIEVFIEDSVLAFLGEDEKRWAGKYNYAQAYLVAHLLSSGEASEAGDASVKVGPVTSKSAGGVSVTRNAMAKDRSDSDDFFMTTAYGQRFIMIRNMTFAGVLVANQL